MRAQSKLRGPIPTLVCIIAGFSLLIFAIQYSLTGPGLKLGVSNKEEVEILLGFQNSVQQCVVPKRTGSGL